PITNEPRYTIPVKMFNNKLESGEKSMDLAMIAEAVFYQEKALEAKHKAEPLLNIYYSLLKDSKQVVKRGEDGQAILVDKEASYLTEQTRFMINNYLYSKGRSETEDEEKYGKATDKLISYLR